MRKLWQSPFCIWICIWGDPGLPFLFSELPLVHHKLASALRRHQSKHFVISLWWWMHLHGQSQQLQCSSFVGDGPKSHRWQATPPLDKHESTWSSAAPAGNSVQAGSSWRSPSPTPSHSIHPSFPRLISSSPILISSGLCLGNLMCSSLGAAMKRRSSGEQPSAEKSHKFPCS